MNRLRWFVAGLALSLALGAAAPAQAIPVFAHRYGYTCTACHTVVPHLTAFGELFLARGYRLPGVAPKPAFPIAVRIEGAYASGVGGDEGAGRLPKTIVDEVEVLTGGAVGTRGSYWVEQYAIDGGFPGLTRDAWYAQRLSGDGASVPVVVRGGQFTLPLPLDPETFRETTTHYAIWDQTSGSNPFTFFDPKIGVQAEAGDPARGVAGTINILQGHDRQSGLPSTGLDTMVTLQRDLGAVSLSAYRYDGSRSIAGPAYDGSSSLRAGDRFWRNGFAAGWGDERTRVDAVYQNGNDTAAGIYGDALVSSGGFVQARRMLGPRVFAIARWDATQATTFSRSLTTGVGWGVTRNSRWTFFDTLTRDENGHPINMLTSSVLVAF